MHICYITFANICFSRPIRRLFVPGIILWHGFTDLIQLTNTPSHRSWRKAFFIGSPQEDVLVVSSWFHLTQTSLLRLLAKLFCCVPKIWCINSPVAKREGAKKLEREEKRKAVCWPKDLFFSPVSFVHLSESFILNWEPILRVKKIFYSLPYINCNLPI